MDYLNNILSYVNWNTSSILDIFIVLFWTFFLSLFIWFVYKITYKWKNYFPSYLQTLIVLSIIVSLVILIVWTNAASAISLLWIFSIIRFRNNLKDTRDLWFIFFAVAIWFAMWMKLYLIWIIWTIIVSAIFFIMSKINFFTSGLWNSYILKIRFTDNADFNEKIEQIFLKFKIEWILSNLNCENSEIPEEIEDPTTHEITINTKNIEIFEANYEIHSKNILDIKTILIEINSILKPISINISN